MNALLSDALSGAKRLLIGAAAIALVAGVVYASAEVALLVHHARAIGPYMIGQPSCSADGQHVYASFGIGIVGSHDGGKTWQALLSANAAGATGAQQPSSTEAQAHPQKKPEAKP